MGIKEFGGYFPLDLKKGNEYYRTCGSYEVRSLNSGRSAIYEAIIDSGAKNIWLPIYLCSSVNELLTAVNVSIKYYNIDEDFMPVNITAYDDIVLYVNYFGIQPEDKISAVVKKYRRVILDNTQAFFCKPVENAYNVYSCRKFFGVPDGSYLITDKFIHEQKTLPGGVSYATALFMLKALDMSTNEAYRDSLDNEARIEKEGVCSMSKLTRSILASIDYEEYREQRRKNYGELCKSLNSINEILPPSPADINTYFAPMCYPLLIKSEGLRKYLVSNCIYVPQWWKSVISHPSANEWEKYISQYLLPLPVDHRYSAEDMRYIAEVIMNYLNSNL